VALLTACLMAAAASNTQAHQTGSIGAGSSEVAGPFSFLVSLYRSWAIPPKGPYPPVA
jgi:hypothetical protein